MPRVPWAKPPGSGASRDGSKPEEAGAGAGVRAGALHCPTCSVLMVYHPDGFWRCTQCGGEWLPPGDEDSQPPLGADALPAGDEDFETVGQLWADEQARIRAMSQIGGGGRKRGRFRRSKPVRRRTRPLVSWDEEGNKRRRDAA